MSEPKIITLPFSAMEPDRIVTFRCDYWDILPPPSAEQRENTKQSIEKYGIKDPLSVLSIMSDQWVVIDGYNRLTIAVEIGLWADDLKLDQLGQEDDYTEEELDELARSLNEDRRQLTEEYQAKRRAERIARVAELREEGRSIRDIADEVGISKSQVAKDLLSTGGQLKEPEKIIGKDGKERPAKMPPREENQEALALDIPPKELTPKTSAVTPCKRDDCPSSAWGSSEYCEDHSLRISDSITRDTKSGPGMYDQAEAKRATMGLTLRPQELPTEHLPLAAQSSSGSASPDVSTVEDAVNTALANAGPLDPKTLLPLSQKGAAAESSTPTKTNGGFQHYNTPDWLLVPIRKVSPIALDPFHNQWSLVKALLTFTKEEDGLREDRNWAELTRGKGQTYANPPYENPLPIAHRFVLEAKRGAEITSCLPSSHSTEWYKLLRKHCQAFCQLNRKVDFGKEGVFGSTAFHESTLFYFGPQAKKFRASMESNDPKTGEPYGYVTDGAPYVVIDERQVELPILAAPQEKREHDPLHPYGRMNEAGERIEETPLTCLHCGGPRDIPEANICDECNLDGITCAVCFEDIAEVSTATMLTAATRTRNATWECARHSKKEETPTPTERPADHDATAELYGPNKEEAPRLHAILDGLRDTHKGWGVKLEFVSIEETSNWELIKELIDDCDLLPLEAPECDKPLSPMSLRIYSLWLPGGVRALGRVHLWRLTKEETKKASKKKAKGQPLKELLPALAKSLEAQGHLVTVSLREDANDRWSVEEALYHLGPKAETIVESPLYEPGQGLLPNDEIPIMHQGKELCCLCADLDEYTPHLKELLSATSREQADEIIERIWPLFGEDPESALSARRSCAWRDIVGRVKYADAKNAPPGTPKNKIAKPGLLCANDRCEEKANGSEGFCVKHSPLPKLHPTLKKIAADYQRDGFTVKVSTPGSQKMRSVMASLQSLKNVEVVVGEHERDDNEDLYTVRFREWKPDGKEGRDICSLHAEGHGYEGPSTTQAFMEESKRLITACNYVGEGTKIFDERIKTAPNDEAKEALRKFFAEWKATKPAAKPYNAKPKAPAPKRNKGKNEEVKKPKGKARRP